MTRFSGRWRAIALCAMLGMLIGACTGPAPLSARDRGWQQDIALLARELPADRAGKFGPVSPQAWRADAARLEAAVPRLTDGQITTGMAQLVAMLHDDETAIEFPPAPFLHLDAQWIQGGLYLLAVPPAHRDLLGARLLAMDGHPISQVLARAGTTIDAGNPQLLSDFETGALTEPGLLHSLGLTASPTSAVLTVRTRAGAQRKIRLTATGSGSVGLPFVLADEDPGLAHVPLPGYRQGATRPYWLQVMPTRHAVYLKYNQCLPDAGFQRLAAQALGLLRAHPDYRLIVDLRDNLGGASLPFDSLITGLAGDPRLSAPGRVFGLVNQFTDSSATVDAEHLKDAGAILIGQPPADPLDSWGDGRTFRLPRSGLLVGYTTAAINKDGFPWGIPEVVVEPTLTDILTGDDPVLAAALSYRP